MKRALSICLVLFSLSSAASLASLAATEGAVGAVISQGQISRSDQESLLKIGKALRKSFSDITEEEEYYIGRSVAALILSTYPVYENEPLTRYINTIGQAVVFSSERPEIYAGYHFLVLDTGEVNAMAAPSGFIFITRGLLERCDDEEMLASILAHEVGHVCAKHGLRSIKKSRLVDAFRVIGEEAGRKYASEELAELTAIFEDVLGDIVATLIERGYDRKFEYEADEMSVEFAAETGYSPQGLLGFLQTMVGDSSAVSGKGWFKTHPTAEERIKRTEKNLRAIKNPPQEEPLRTARFERMKAGLK